MSQENPYKTEESVLKQVGVINNLASDLINALESLAKMTRYNTSSYPSQLYPHDLQKELLLLAAKSSQIMRFNEIPSQK